MTLKYTSIGLPDELYDLLHNLNKETGIPKRVFITKALEEFFNKDDLKYKIEKKDYPGILGLFMRRD